MKTIFVSSTFKDMHFERDAIQEITLPALKSEAIKYGENVSFCDLRWGINTGDLDSEEGSRKVLDVCLDEIDRCKPPMVVILGDRYGWIPSEELTTSAANRKHIDQNQLKKDMELEDLQISVTALEIAYGALSTPERCSQALFYFRHIESDCPNDYTVEDIEHERKLNQLKAKIHELTGGRIKHYSVRWDGNKLDGVISFAEMLAEDIRQVLTPEWKKKELLTPFERERLTHWSFITEKNAMFSARSSLVQTLFDDLTAKEKHFLAIKAPSGSGKSMLFSNLALKLRDSGYDVVPFVSGLTAESNDSVDILRNTIFYMEEILGFAHEKGLFEFHSLENPAISEEEKKKTNGIDKLRERLFELCLECEQASKQVIIMVDAIDQLASDENRDNLVFIPERLSANVKFFMTCLPELATEGRDTISLKPINDAEKREVIDGILKSHNRELEERVIRRMIKSKSSNNPLFLSLLVQRLLMMNREDFLAIKKAGDDMNAITKHQLEVIDTCPDSLQKMSAALLTEAGKRINEELVRKVAEYLAVSRHGLRSEDLAALLGDTWSALDFAHFISYMDENFIQRDDGRFDFSHKCIREGFLAKCHDTKEIHQALANHFYYLTSSDGVCSEEITYHCIMANDTSSLLQYILNNEHIPQKLYAVSKTLLLRCETDSCEWINNFLRGIDSTNIFIHLCEAMISSFDQVTSNSLLHNRILYHISKFICSQLDHHIPNDTSYNILMVKAHIWCAQRNKNLIISSFYSEGDYALFVSYYEKAYAIAEKCRKDSSNKIWLCFMADCAFQLIHHDPETNNGTYNFHVFGNYYISYCKKAVEHFEELIQYTGEEEASEWMIKYAICLIGLAAIEEYRAERKSKIDIVNRGDNPHIKKATEIASNINNYLLKNEDILCQLYQDLARFYSDINNIEYMNQSLFFLEKALTLLQRGTILLKKKFALQSVLISYIRYQIAFNKFDATPDHIKYALDISKELFKKTTRFDLLNDIITLNACYWNCVTHKASIIPEANSILALEIETGNYLYHYANLSFGDKLLVKTIVDHAEKMESLPRYVNLLNASSVFVKKITMFFYYFLKKPQTIKKSRWLTPYFGIVSRTLRMIDEHSKFNDGIKKRMHRLNEFILFYLKINQKKMVKLKEKNN